MTGGGPYLLGERQVCDEGGPYSLREGRDKYVTGVVPTHWGRGGTSM